VARRRRPRFEKWQGSEADLCADLIAHARADGYVVHPETSGWDVLLVDTDGTQAGVQAKLRAGLEVLCQALQPPEKQPGPARHAVLIPVPNYQLSAVARAAGIAVLLPGGGPRWALSRARVWQHPEPAWVPERPVEVPAGVPGPRLVTRWKVAAVKLCAVLRARGFLTRADFREHGVDPRWWLRGPSRCLVTDGNGVYTEDSERPGLLPDLRWPEVVAAVSPRGDTVPEPP